jgi:hypothetical protein
MRSLILDQVSNGLAVRMAVLYLLAGGSVVNQHMLQAQTKVEPITTGGDAPTTSTTTRPAAIEQLQRVVAGQSELHEK